MPKLLHPAKDNARVAGTGFGAGGSDGKERVEAGGQPQEGGVSQWTFATSPISR